MALARLGADVCVIGLSAANGAYATDLAREADVPLRCVVADVLHLPPSELTDDCDIALMELGVLPYFANLKPLGSVIAMILRPGGRLVRHHFHPATAKL